MLSQSLCLIAKALIHRVCGVLSGCGEAYKMSELIPERGEWVAESGKWGRGRRSCLRA